VDPAFAPHFQWSLFAIGLIAGCFKEIGWTGSATPRLLARHRPFIAGLWLGLVWALWHVLVDFRQNFNAQGLAWLLEFAVFYIATLTAYRLLMTWVYAHTQSLLLAVLVHASNTGWLLVFYPATTFKQGFVWETALSVTLWVAVAVTFAGFAPRESRIATKRASMVGKSSGAA
jgi:membrane protease YdiL (CAAX protease family)